jgi:hypothetical protein
MSGRPATQERTSKPSFSFRLSSKKHIHRLVENRHTGEPMLLFPKSQYISEQAGAPDILSLHPIFSSSWLNPLISSSHIFRYAYNPTQCTLQQYKGTGLQTLLTPGMQHQVPRILLVLSSHSSPSETPSVPQFLGFRAFRGASLSLRLTERAVSGIIGLNGPCGPGGDA